MDYLCNCAAASAAATALVFILDRPPLVLQPELLSLIAPVTVALIMAGLGNYQSRHWQLSWLGLLDSTCLPYLAGTVLRVKSKFRN